MCVLQRHEQREVVEPGGLFPAELVEALANRKTTCLESFEDPRPEGASMRDHLLVVDASGTERRCRAKVCFIQQPLRLQILQADEQWIASEGREGLIRRIAVAGGA